jgi:hypothetical protein
MLFGVRLPAAVGQHLYIGSGLKKSFLVTDRLKLPTARPGKCGQRLCVAAAKHPMRPESLSLKHPSGVFEKSADSFNRVVVFYFVESLDHRFISGKFVRKQV